MELEFLNKPANKRTFSGQAAIWVSKDTGANWTRLSNSAELTITPETSESETQDNAGHGHFDDVLKNYIIEGKFLERGEDIRQVWTDDDDQDLRGALLSVWIQGADLVNTGGTTVYEQWAFYQCRLKRNHGPYALGTGEAMFTFTLYSMANATCADVTIPPPSGDDCYLGLVSGAATVVHGEFHQTMDNVAT